ncbi:MAG TPA: DUF1622 domain-containing protein [Dermatophilaceae bacterium]|nr:DUF1622 domain-containing protein [Dermatophilaceae bacterium]
MDFTEAVQVIALGFEVVGIAIITIGGVVGVVRAAMIARSRNLFSFYDEARDGFARPLLLGLEVLVAADIIETITVDRSLESTAALGLLVLIRVILSFSLEAETEGVLPWRKAQWQADRAASTRAGIGDRPEPEALP